MKTREAQETVRPILKEGEERIERIRSIDEKTIETAKEELKERVMKWQL